MNQITKYNQQLQAQEDQRFNIRPIIGKLLDSWVVIFISLIVCLVGAFLINRYTQPLYISRSSVLVTEPKDVNNAVSELLYGQELFGTSSVNLENEAYLIKSFALTRETLEDLEFNVTYFLPGQITTTELYYLSPIKVEIIAAPTGIPIEGQLTCERVNQNSFKLTLEEESLLDRIMGVVETENFESLLQNKTFSFGDEINLNGFIFKITRTDRVWPEESNNILFKLHDYDMLTEAYLKDLKVFPLSMESSILEISIISGHFDKGRHFIDRLVENYIENELSRKNHTAEMTIDFINNQILLMSDSLSSVENRLESFKQSNTDLTISSEGNNYLQVSQEFEATKSQLRLSNRYLDELATYINQDNLDQIVVPSSIGIADPALNKSIQDLVALQLQVKSITSSKNPVLRSYQQRIEALKQSILENIRSLKISNNMAINDIDQQIGGMKSTLRNLPSAEREFINIQRNYNLSENLYLFLMEKKAEAGIAKASNTIDIRVINGARTKIKPITPKPLFNLALAAVLGLALPIGIILLSDLLNDKIKSKDELLRLTNIPFLGVIARNKQKKTELVNSLNARTEVSETFRTIRSNLRYMVGNSVGGKTFLFTSSVSAEGKSFCANNLAAVFSNFGKRVLLIDADLRKEKNYEEQFAVSDEIGLSDYLAGLVTKESIIRSTELPNLSIITSGGIPPNPSELLIGGVFDDLLKELKAQFDYILIDTPPIGIISDALEIVNDCDVCIYVIRENYTLRRHVQDLNHLLTHRKLQNLAILLNAVNYDKAEYGGYGKYYNKYYGKAAKNPVKVYS